MIVFGGPGALLISIDNTGTKVLGGILLVLAAYFASFFVIYYNVALAAGADQALRGQDPDIAKAKGVARGRIGVIAKWAAGVGGDLAPAVAWCVTGPGSPVTSSPASAGPSGR